MGSAIPAAGARRRAPHVAHIAAAPPRAPARRAAIPPPPLRAPPSAYGHRVDVERLAGGGAAWGCAWFAAWKRSVAAAAWRGERLVVYYFRGEKGRGRVAWGDLAAGANDPWDGVGLGGSQKVEVAFLERM
eukprot:gene822-3075_t